MNDVKNDIASAVEAYLNSLAELNKPTNTLLAYRRDFAKFLEFCSDRGFSSCAQISETTVSEFKNHMRTIGLSTASASRCLSAVRSLFKYLISIGSADTNPAKAIHNDLPEQSDVSVLTKKEVEILLALPDVSDAKGIRDKAMLELLYATGIKVSELIELNVDDIMFSIQCVRVGKPGKQRMIPLYKLALNEIRDYIDKSRNTFICSPDETSLFVNANGERLTRQGFWKILKYYAIKSNIAKDITPHTLRHSFAAHMLENGADLKAIQEILGHSDISSTQRYALFLREKVFSNNIKFHPRA